MYLVPKRQYEENESCTATFQIFPTEIQEKNQKRIPKIFAKKIERKVFQKVLKKNFKKIIQFCFSKKNISKENSKKDPPPQ